MSKAVEEKKARIFLSRNNGSGENIRNQSGWSLSETLAEYKLWLDSFDTNEPKYISFVEQTNPGKLTKIFYVMTKDGSTLLGMVKWETGWRKYVWYPQGDTLFDAGCLDDIRKFLNRLMTEHREILEQKKLNNLF